MRPADIKAGLDRLSNAVRANPQMARASLAPVVATVVNGLRCRVAGSSGEQIETDMPRAMGGESVCPSPGWIFRASLAACCATMITAQAARLGIVLTNLEVRVGADGDTRGLLGLGKMSAGYSTLRTDVEIGSNNADPEQLRELVRWAEAHSPVGCTVRDSPPNVLRVVIADEVSAT